MFGVGVLRFLFVFGLLLCGLLPSVMAAWSCSSPRRCWPKERVGLFGERGGMARWFTCVVPSAVVFFGIPRCGFGGVRAYLLLISCPRVFCGGGVYSGGVWLPLSLIPCSFLW